MSLIGILFGRVSCHVECRWSRATNCFSRAIRAAHSRAGDNKPLQLDRTFRGVSRRSTQWIRKAGFTLSKLCAVSVRDLPIKNRTTGWPRPKNGRGSDNLANSGRPAQANHQDLRKKENEPLSALPGGLRRNYFGGRSSPPSPRRSCPDRETALAGSRPHRPS
jgi:hypothetical protein